MRVFSSLKISSFFDLTLSKTETGDGIELVLPSYPGVVSDNFDVSFNFEEKKSIAGKLRRREQEYNSQISGACKGCGCLSSYKRGDTRLKFNIVMEMF